MSHKINIFITGATGYIGGSVLHRILNHAQVETFDVTALVRSSEKARRLQSHGVNAVVGSLEDHTLLEQLASKANVVINVADCDDLQATQAILRGLKIGAKTSTPILIHTSGTATLMDNAAGRYTSDIIYDDIDIKQFENLPETQPHRPVDIAIVEADQEGYVQSYIIIPPTIYGLANNDFVVDGIQNKHSIQIPDLIRVSLAKRQGGMVGFGRNVWCNVHVDDIADLYIVILDHILSGADIAHGREGIYFGENGEHNLYDVGKAIAEALADIGRGENREPITFTKEDFKEHRGFEYIGSNARCRATRSRSIGWKPIKNTADMLKSIKMEVDELLLDSSSHV